MALALSLMCSNLASAQPAASIWFTATTSSATPMLRQIQMCSSVCPARPASNSPGAALSTNSIASACAAPATMLGTKSRWPGASSTLILRRSVWMKAVLTSIVTPRSRSSAPWSRRKAYLNELFPSAFASFSHRCKARGSTAPASRSSRPIRVDLPASTCPTTTRLSCSDARAGGPRDTPAANALLVPRPGAEVTQPPVRSTLRCSRAASTEAAGCASAGAAVSASKPIPTSAPTAMSSTADLLCPRGALVGPSPGGSPRPDGGPAVRAEG
eukprot:scaffold1504_cov111-Isochrysis_galbana.AAC.6